jgi:hypothetical protein
LKFSLERYLFLLARWILFPAARTPIRACDRSRSSNLINAISVEEELERAQSKPTLAKAFSEQVRHRAAPTFQSGFNFFLGVVSFLFPSNFIN